MRQFFWDKNQKNTGITTIKGQRNSVINSTPVPGLGSAQRSCVLGFGGGGRAAGSEQWEHLGVCCTSRAGFRDPISFPEVLEQLWGGALSRPCSTFTAQC